MFVSHPPASGGRRLAALCVVMAIAALGSANAAAPQAGAPAMIRRGYVDASHGQVHFRRAGPPGTSSRGTVVLLHETPVSSYEYEPLMRELARDHVVVAFDTPGFGMSDRIAAGPVTIADYAAALGDAMEALLPDDGRPLAVFGFHTGAALALELALARSGRVDALMLGGVPFRTASERAERLAALPRDKGAAALGARLQEYWQLSVEKHPPGVPAERAMQLFAEMVQGKDTYWWAYEAVWRYPIEERLARVRQPALVLAPHEMLLDQTRRAAAAIPHARLVELPELREWVLDLGAERLAREMRTFIAEVAAAAPRSHDAPPADARRRE